MLSTAGAPFATASSLTFPIKMSAKAGIWYELPTKIPDATAVHPTQEVSDLVRLATAAHRRKAGQLIWATWQPGGAEANVRNPKQISSGTMLLMMTSEGARHVLTNMQLRGDHGVDPATRDRCIAPGHFDIALREFLKDAEAQPNGIEWSYVFPPIGNYYQHRSGCDVKNYGTGDGRPSCWDERWCCEGTRKSQDSQGRDKFLMRWSRKRKPEPLGEAIDVAELGSELNWISRLAGPGGMPSLTGKYAELASPDDVRLVRQSPQSSGLVRQSPQSLGQAPVADAAAKSKPPDRQRRSAARLVHQRSLRYWAPDLSTHADCFDSKNTAPTTFFSVPWNAEPRVVGPLLSVFPRI